MKRIFPVLIIAAFLAVAGCAEPVKYTNKKVPLCLGTSTKLGGIPYTTSGACAVAIHPFDVGIWNEAPLNSHMARGARTAQVGCKPLTAGAVGCVDCTTPGHSNTLMVNFDPTAYNEDITVIKAVLAVYSPDNPQGLQEVYLRGRLNVGDDLQSLARNREGVVNCVGRAEGWVFFDVSNFVARAIKERRNSIHFEVSLPCQPARLVAVGVNQNEPRLIVEYQ